MRSGKTLIFFIVLFALIFLCGCGDERYTVDKFKDGQTVPELEEKSVEAVHVGDKRLTGQTLSEFLEIYNRSTVKFVDGGTTPDVQVFIFLTDGTRFCLDLVSSDAVEVRFDGVRTEQEIKLENPSLVEFIRSLVPKQDAD